MCGHTLYFFWEIIRFYYIHPTNPSDAPHSLTYYEKDTDILFTLYLLLPLLPTSKMIWKISKKEYKVQIKHLGRLACLL